MKLGEVNSSHFQKDKYEIEFDPPISRIPEELLFKIFTFVPVEDLSRLWLVSKLWNRVGHDLSLFDLFIKRMLKNLNPKGREEYEFVRYMLKGREVEEHDLKLAECGRKGASS